METLRNCPSCGHDHIKFNRQVRDHFLSKEDFRLMTCFSCGLIFTNPRPDARSIGAYYKSDEYISHSNKRGGLFATLYHLARSRNLKWKYDKVGQYCPAGSVLDIGCGTGEFLAYMKERGWETLGIEPDQGARNQATFMNKVDVYGEEHLETIADESQDAVTLWHVLEHVHGLQVRVAAIHRVLKPGAFAFIALPNPQSHDALHYDGLWAAWDVPRHLYHFTSAAITDLFHRNGMQHIASFPMKLDSYYVSILSERYKGNTLAPLSGMIQGFISNRKAGSNPELYSSTLYVYRK